MISAADLQYMEMALCEADAAALEGEVPVGAVIVCDDRVVARCHNLTQTLNDVTAHAEMMAITAAAEALGGKYLDKCTLYVTLEPCAMCAGAIAHSHIGRVVYGASDPKRGYTTIYRPDIKPFHPKTLITTGVLADESTEILQNFFKNRR